MMQDSGVCMRRWHGLALGSRRVIVDNKAKRRTFPESKEGLSSSCVCRLCRLRPRGPRYQLAGTHMGHARVCVCVQHVHVWKYCGDSSRK